MLYENIDVNEYFVKGKISLDSAVDNFTKVNLYTNDPNFKFFSIRSNFPIDCDANVCTDVLYSILATGKCETSDFNKIFDSGFQLIDHKICSFQIPLFKKLNYSHFPHVVIGNLINFIKFKKLIK